MRATIENLGNSAAVCIPQNILEEAQLTIGCGVDIRADNGCIVIEPVHSHDSKLVKLLAEINAEHLHGETDFGPIAGREMLIAICYQEFLNVQRDK